MSERGVRVDRELVATEKLDQLHLPAIPMTVPFDGDMILIGSAKDTPTTTLVCRVIAPGQSLQLYRRDGRGVNSYADSEDIDQSERLMFEQPVDYIKVNRRADDWFIDVDQGNVTSRERLLGFMGVVATFAYRKQRQLEVRGTAGSYLRWIA